MSRIIMPTDHVIKKSLVPSFERYKEMYQKSLEDPETFWSELADELYWQQPYQRGNFMSYNFDLNKGNIFTKWMEDGITNVCFNVLDRIVREGYGARVAYYWEGNSPEDYSRLTYNALLESVCTFANGLRDIGLLRGDTAAIYMPMILETPIAMLACARIGVIHTVVFAGFSSDSLAERMSHCKAKVLITADGVWRGGKLLVLKNVCDEACKKAKEKYNHKVGCCIVVDHISRVTACGTLPGPISSLYEWHEERDSWWIDIVKGQSKLCRPEWLDAEDPLFILYTSGSTGKPKGVVHTQAGYMLYALATFKYVFDYNEGDIYWCTADMGWITGHTYVVYGPLANGASSVLFEGTPFYPEYNRYWEVVEKYQVNQFYTSPTAIRALTKHGDEHVTKHELKSLRVLGTVGEPINPEAWMWYYNMIGYQRCSIVDTFWQTETGGHVLTGLPGATPMKPGAAGFPFFGVEPQILDEDGRLIQGAGEGYLVFSRPWPGMMRSLYRNHARFVEVYFTKFPGYYCTGDGATRDRDGFIWVTGRIDDMLNVSGHLMSTAEVEGILTEDPNVSEAAVVSKPHPIKGESLYCFITLNEGKVFNCELTENLEKLVRSRIGAFAVPDMIQLAPGLPKTRSGKIMRRILRKIAIGDANLGDTSTLADPSVLDDLWENRPLSY